MITIVCHSCSQALRVTGDPQEIEFLVGEGSEFWPDAYTCGNCGGSCVYYATTEIEALAALSLRTVNLNPQEAFAALNGFGLPSERTCCQEVILPYFEAAGIKVKGTQPRGQLFFRVEELTFPDGTVMSLAPSPQGAVIFRVKKPHSYAVGVVETNV